VDVALPVLRRIEVDHVRDLREVEPASRHVRATSVVTLPVWKRSSAARARPGSCRHAALRRARPGARASRRGVCAALGADEDECEPALGLELGDSASTFPSCGQRRTGGRSRRSGVRSHGRPRSGPDPACTRGELSDLAVERGEKSMVCRFARDAANDLVDLGLKPMSSIRSPRRGSRRGCDRARRVGAQRDPAGGRAWRRGCVPLRSAWPDSRSARRRRQRPLEALAAGGINQRFRSRRSSSPPALSGSGRCCEVADRIRQDPRVRRADRRADLPQDGAPRRVISCDPRSSPPGRRKRSARSRGGKACEWPLPTAARDRESGKRIEGAHILVATPGRPAGSRLSADASRSIASAS